MRAACWGSRGAFQQKQEDVNAVEGGNTGARGLPARLGRSRSGGATRLSIFSARLDRKT
jgi:hypothetical protein